ncbi:MAG: Deoxyuridine 5'-triphosphate nucleotidohydrolase [Alphaproteobacteria bacterium UBA4588]|nr:MAG: Deoxyuridine 5'-triphosphate nucleotidohydrolase [Alphaproteobacteria bacterium UBA4588]
MTKISFLQATHACHLPLPAYQTAGAAGMDLQAALGPDTVTLLPGMRTAVPTGLHLSMPPTMEAQIRPRSGLALKQGVTVVNAPGTIDSDYRGEIKILLINLGQEPVEITDGMRIAQMVLAPILRPEITQRDTLDGTERGSGGFGSTGTGS